MSWTLYKAGKYRLKAPKASGLYPVAALDGGFRGYVEVVRTEHGMRYLINGLAYSDPCHAHAGYWWSVPVPPQRNANENELASYQNTARYPR